MDTTRAAEGQRDHRSSDSRDQDLQSSDGRDERPLERLDRNENELMTELRVAGTGIQVLLAFLLVVPFNNRFTKLSTFDRYSYFFALMCIAIAAVLLIAPMVHHRLLFRQGKKSYLVKVGNRSAIVAMVFLSVGLTGILVLVSNVVFGGLMPIIVGFIAAPTVGWAWFGVPLILGQRGDS
jgi:Family of unknown function (DUF6328)